MGRVYESSVELLSEHGEHLRVESFKELLTSHKKSEQYQMLNATDPNENTVLIINRLKVTYDDEECVLFNITDITSLYKSKIEQEKRTLLQTLNTSIHHELLSPLNANVTLSEALLSKLESIEHKHMVQLILTSSNLAKFHANDLLDYSVLNKGCFSSSYTPESISLAVE